nr:Rne/Rng family ribonuclease [Actinomyces dentalis]
MPAASLLFQAPDPSRARRRRVTAAQAAPGAAPAAEPRGGARPAKSAQSGKRDGSAESVRPAKSAQSDKHDASAEPAESAESGGTGTAEGARPTRGRRRRRATAAQAAPEHAPAATTHHQTPVGTDSGPDDSGDEGASGRRRRARGRRGAGTRRAEAPETPETPDGGDKADADEAGAARTGDARADAGPADSEQDPDSGQGPAHEEREEEGAEDSGGRRKRRRGGRGRRSRSRSEAPEDAVEQTAEEGAGAEPAEQEGAEPAGAREEAPVGSRRRRRRRSRARSDSGRDVRDEVTGLKGSTRLEAKRQRRREGRAAGRRRPIITEAEFLARRESVDRQMIVREQDGLNQIALLEDGLLVEHYVARHTQVSMVGNVYVGRVQNVLPSMEAAFVDLGRGRNAVLYAGEVNWDAAGMEGRPRRIEDALKSGDAVLVQVTKDPIGHKGARLTSQVTLAGRYLVLVPGGTMTGISRKLPDTERSRLKKILKRIVPDDAGVIVRTAAEGASEEQLVADVERLVKQWQTIDKKSKRILSGSGKAPVLLKGEPELAVRVVRDVFNEDFRSLVVQGDAAWATISKYVRDLSPDLVDRLEHWVRPEDVFTAHRIDEQLAKGFDRKVWLPSGGTLIIDRTEAMTVIDVNTGRFTGAGGTLEETVTRNNIEAAEEIVRQLRLRDIGGMIVIDFVDMVLESNRDLVLRRLVECLGRDRTRHQVTEVTSLGLVQMTRKRVGQGLVEAFSTPCECCGGRGFIVHSSPVENQEADTSASASRAGRKRGRKGRDESSQAPRGGRKDRREDPDASSDATTRAAVRGALAQIAAAAEHAHQDRLAPDGAEPAGAGQDEPDPPAERD